MGTTNIASVASIVTGAIVALAGKAGSVDAGTVNNSDTSGHLNMSISTFLTSPTGIIMFRISSQDTGYLHVLLNTSASTDGNYVIRLAIGTHQGSITTNVSCTYSSKTVKVTGNALGSQSTKGTWFYVIF